jgi:flagellar motility protein MotE (MotC chaperone)
MRFRLLPIVILVTAISFGLKVEGLWSGVSTMMKERQSSTVGNRISEVIQLAGNEAQAQEATAPEESPAQAIMEDRPYPVEPAAAPVSQTADLPADPFAMTDEEIELLQALSQRRSEIDQRERDVKGREALLAAAEKRVDEKVKRLEDLQRKIERLLVQYDDQEEKRFANLVAIYEKMKPKEAARIFNQLEMDVLLKVIERMNQRRSAPVLAEMAPSKAKEVTMELANRRDLPLPRD